MLLVSTQQTPLSTRGLIKAQKHKAEEEESCFLPEQINFISMNPCSQCFLLAHLNRQEANFNWSPPHSAAVHVATGWEERERKGGGAGRHVSERRQRAQRLQKDRKESKKKTG